MKRHGATSKQVFIASARPFHFLAIVLLSQMVAFAQAGKQRGRGFVGRIPVETLNRSVPLRKGIGLYHEKVTTASALAQKFFDQGATYLHSYVWIEAARSFHQALRSDPNMAMAYLGLSYAYSPMDYSAARVALKQAEALSNGLNDREQRRIRIRGLQLDAMAEAKNGDKLLSFRQALEEALAAYPEDVDFLLLRGHSEEPTPFGDGQGCVPSALPYYQRALTLSSGNFAAHHFLAHCYENEGRFTEAIQHARDYARLAPGIPHAQHMYAHELRCVGRVDEAIQFFLKADALEEAYYQRENIPAALDWHHAHNLSLLASAYQYVGQGRRAERYFEQERLLPPLTEYAAFNRKDWPEFLLNRGEYARALKAAQQMVRSQAALARVAGHALAGTALVALHRADQANQELSSAQSEYERISSADAASVVSYLEALQLELVLARGPTPDAPPLVARVVRRIRVTTSADSWSQGLFRLEVIATLARSTGHWDVAEEFARQMLDDDHYYAGSHYAMALIAEHSGDLEAARREFTAAYEYWGHADPDFPGLVRVRKSLAAIEPPPNSR